MSEFDKEAEREKLRERFEREEADRAAAQQMSDLLLKGATMTNAHCGECGSPVFRQNGQEFCPSCGAQRTEEATDGNAESAGADATDDPATDQQPATGAQQPAARTQQPTADAEQAGAGDQSAVEDGRPAGASTPQAAGRDDAAVANATQAPSAGPDGVAGAPTDGAEAGAAPADAVTALQRALLRHARAADTDDPRVALEHLEAAHEAAATLATLRE